MISTEHVRSQRSLRPDDEFDISVTVVDIRRRTYVLDITGRTPLGKVVFIATLTPVCVARDQRRAIEIPDKFRQALHRHRDDCATAAVAKPAGRHAERVSSQRRAS